MNNSQNSRTQLTQSTQFYSTFLKAGMIITPIATLLPWIAKSALNGPYYGIFTFEGYVAYSDVAWTTVPLIIAIFAQILSITPLMIGLFILNSIISNYNKGEIFSLQNAINYRRLSLLLLLDIEGILRSANPY